MDKSGKLIDEAIKLREKLKEAHFEFSGYIYNPLDYAFCNYSEFVKMAVRDEQKALFMGMNPGPFGMVQTGVPFGEINAVRDYLGIDNPVGRPMRECPKRPVEGMNIKRSEISGARFWSLAKCFGEKEDFFSIATVINYCPLAFISESGVNITPVELSKNDRRTLESICDESLRATLDILSIPMLIAVGKYAYDKLSEFSDVQLFMHPSPRNPKSRLFWPEGASLELRRLIDG